MNKIKEFIPSWQFLVGVVVISLLSVWLLLPLCLKLFSTIAGKLKGATALLIAALILALSVGTVSAKVVSADSSTPVMLAAHTDTVTSELGWQAGSSAPLFATVGNGEMLLALALGGICSLAVFLFTSKRLPRYCAALTGGAFVFGATLFYPMKAAAAQYLDQAVARQIIIRSQSTSDASNGLEIAYGPSGTNWQALLTNGQLVRLLGAIRRTNFTGFVVVTNAAGGGYQSNGYISGDLVCTNCPGDVGVLQGNLN